MPDVPSPLTDLASERLVVRLSQVSRADLPLVGGKGANLGAMAAAGFPVPAGFCLTTHAYDAFLEAALAESWLVESLARLTSTANPTQVQSVGKEIRTRLTKVDLPERLRIALKEAWEEAGTEYAYAVRSSATAEDLPEASFAGQQDTLLNVVGLPALEEAVRACFASLYTDRAIIYRAERGIRHEEVRLSVVVQRMVHPDVSGLLFTADPVSGHRYKLVLEASFGLGEALVSGLVMPDRYVIDRRGMVDVDVTLGEKRIAIRPVEGGGTRTEELPDSLRQERALTDAQVRVLSQMGLRLEALFGGPQDIEWCLKAGTFYIVQSRPITTLFPLPAPAPTDGRLRAYLCFNHVQVMTDAMPPLATDVWRYFMPLGREDLKRPNPFLLTAGGRLYLDMTAMLLHSKVGPVIPHMLVIADEGASRACFALLKRPDFTKGASSDLPARTRRLMAFFGPIGLSVFTWIWLRRPEGGIRAAERLTEKRLEQVRRGLASLPRGVERMRGVVDVVLLNVSTRFFQNFFPLVASGIASSKLLPKVAGPYASVADLEAVMCGLQGNITTEMGLELADLADRVRPQRALREVLLAMEGWQPEAVSAVPGGEEFLKALERFLTRFGMRAPGEIDISRPRYRDNPALLLKVVLGHLKSEVTEEGRASSEGEGAIGAHRLRHAELERLGWEAGERLEKAASQARFGWIRRLIVKRLVRVMRNMMAVREHPKFLLVKLLALFREELLTEAKRLVEDGRLEAVEDIYFLDIETLLKGLNEPAVDFRSAVRKGRAEHLRFQRVMPPKVLTSEGESIVVPPDASSYPEGALIGSPASPGTVEGFVRVILDPLSEVLYRGEILVAPCTDPGWTPLFVNAAGLLMEVGGVMTHGSVVAREKGIPAVVGIPLVTQRLKTGMKVRIHGGEGYAIVLDEQGQMKESGAGSVVSPLGGRS